jgi:hypothetical protein
MGLHSLLASWKSGLSRGRRPQSRPPRRGTRLVLEQLEDRSLPSSYSAATASDLIADINAANAAGGSNTITLTASPSSPYVLTKVNNYTDGANFLPVIAGNDNLSIVSNGDTINAKYGSGRFFLVANGGSLTLQDLTLTGGNVDNAYTGSVPIGGGAICNLGGTLVLDGVTLSDNVSGSSSCSCLADALGDGGRG